MTIAKWLIRCAEGCGTESDATGQSHLYNLGECLVESNIKHFAWGPLVNMSVNGRQTPTRDAMNGPECKFLCDHSDLILEKTFGKTPVAHEMLDFVDLVVLRRVDHLAEVHGRGRTQSDDSGGPDGGRCRLVIFIFLLLCVCVSFVVMQMLQYAFFS